MLSRWSQLNVERIIVLLREAYGACSWFLLQKRPTDFINRDIDESYALNCIPGKLRRNFLQHFLAEPHFTYDYWRKHAVRHYNEPYLHT
jgi:hypothetical protein